MFIAKLFYYDKVNEEEKFFIISEERTSLTNFFCDFNFKHTKKSSFFPEESQSYYLHNMTIDIYDKELRSLMTNPDYTFLTRDIIIYELADDIFITKLEDLDNHINIFDMYTKTLKKDLTKTTLSIYEREPLSTKEMEIELLGSVDRIPVKLFNLIDDNYTIVPIILTYVNTVIFSENTYSTLSGSEEDIKKLKQILVNGDIIRQNTPNPGGDMILVEFLTNTSLMVSDPAYKINAELKSFDLQVKKKDDRVIDFNNVYKISAFKDSAWQEAEIDSSYYPIEKEEFYDPDLLVRNTIFLKSPIKGLKKGMIIELIHDSNLEATQEIYNSSFASITKDNYIKTVIVEDYDEQNNIITVNSEYQNGWFSVYHPSIFEGSAFTGRVCYQMFGWVFNKVRLHKVHAIEYKEKKVTNQTNSFSFSLANAKMNTINGSTEYAEIAIDANGTLLTKNAQGQYESKYKYLLLKTNSQIADRLSIEFNYNGEVPGWESVGYGTNSMGGVKLILSLVTPQETWYGGTWAPGYQSEGLWTLTRYTHINKIISLLIGTGMFTSVTWEGTPSYDYRTAPADGGSYTGRFFHRVYNGLTAPRFYGIAGASVNHLNSPMNNTIFRGMSASTRFEFVVTTTATSRDYMILTMCSNTHPKYSLTNINKWYQFWYTNNGGTVVPATQELYDYNLGITVPGSGYSSEAERILMTTVNSLNDYFISNNISGLATYDLQTFKVNITCTHYINLDFLRTYNYNQTNATKFPTHKGKLYFDSYIDGGVLYTKTYPFNFATDTPSGNPRYANSIPYIFLEKDILKKVELNDLVGYRNSIDAYVESIQDLNESLFRNETALVNSATFTISDNNGLSRTIKVGDTIKMLSSTSEFGGVETSYEIIGYSTLSRQITINANATAPVGTGWVIDTSREVVKFNVPIRVIGVSYSNTYEIHDEMNFYYTDEYSNVVDLLVYLLDKSGFDYNLEDIRNFIIKNDIVLHTYYRAVENESLYKSLKEKLNYLNILVEKINNVFYFKVQDVRPDETSSITTLDSFLIESYLEEDIEPSTNQLMVNREFTEESTHSVPFEEIDDSYLELTSLEIKTFGDNTDKIRQVFLQKFYEKQTKVTFSYKEELFLNQYVKIENDIFIIKEVQKSRNLSTYIGYKVQLIQSPEVILQEDGENLTIDNFILTMSDING